jgi:hypothetical protein
MSEYSIEKVHDGFVIKVFSQAVLKLSRRRSAVRLLCLLMSKRQLLEAGPSAGLGVVNADERTLGLDHRLGPTTEPRQCL